MLATLVLVREDRDTKAELSRREQAWEVMAETAMSPPAKTSRAVGNTPAYSYSGSMRPSKGSMHSVECRRKLLLPPARLFVSRRS
jgi:hypothetical protein